MGCGMAYNKFAVGDSFKQRRDVMSVGRRVGMDKQHVRSSRLAEHPRAWSLIGAAGDTGRVATGEWGRLLIAAFERSFLPLLSRPRQPPLSPPQRNRTTEPIAARLCIRRMTLRAHTQTCSRTAYLPPCLSHSRSTASTAVHVGCLRFALSPAPIRPPLNARIWYWLCPLQRVRLTRNTFSPLPIALTFCPALATLLTTLRRTQPSAVTSSESLGAAAAAPSSTSSGESLDAEDRADRASRAASMPAARTSLGTVLLSAATNAGKLTWPDPVSAALSRPCAPRTRRSCASVRRAEVSSFPSRRSSPGG